MFGTGIAFEAGVEHGVAERFYFQTKYPLQHMRLEFEPAVTTLPIVEDQVDGHVRADLQDLLKKGTAAAQAGDRERARTLLLQASEIDPDNEDVWMWLASISEYPEELLAFLNRVLEINPQNNRAAEWHVATRSVLAKTFVQRAIAAQEQLSTGLAAECLDQAIELDPLCEMAWYWKASLAESRDEKIECLERVISINPDNSDASDALTAIKRSLSQAALTAAQRMAVTGNTPGALRTLSEFLESEPENIDAWLLRSHLSPHFEEKISSLEKVLEIEPDNANVRSNYDFLVQTMTVGRDEPQSGAESLAAQPVVDVTTAVSAEPEAEGRKGDAHPLIAEAAAAEADLAADADRITLESLAPEVSELIAEDIDEDGRPDEAGDEMVETLLAIHATDPGSKDEEAVLSVDTVSPEQDTLENIPVIETAVETTEPEPFVEPIPEARNEMDRPAVDCPFCNSENDPLAFECRSCRAMLTLSDIETLLSNPNVDREVLQQAVTGMEAEWNIREFDGQELTALAIGHFNLRHFGSGYKYLKEAVRLDPNNVILAGQLHAIAIRLDEISRQGSVYGSIPKGRTILVVDDSPTVRKLISGKLEKSGHNVVCANDGIEALEALKDGLPDLILLDITMPRMDGYEVCRQIRSDPAARDLPVVMISGKDGFFDKVRGRMAGTTGYITKPFGPETLMKALETYLVADAADDAPVAELVEEPSH